MKFTSQTSPHTYLQCSEVEIAAPVPRKSGGQCDKDDQLTIQMKLAYERHLGGTGHLCERLEWRALSTAGDEEGGYGSQQTEKRHDHVFSLLGHLVLKPFSK